MVKRTTLVGLAVALLVVVLLFLLYVKGLSKNPPGFYVDEAGVAYNAYLIAHTGAGESGVRFPLFFQFYTGGFTQWANPTQTARSGSLALVCCSVFWPGKLPEERESGSSWPRWLC